MKNLLDDRHLLLLTDNSQLFNGDPAILSHIKTSKLTSRQNNSQSTKEKEILRGDCYVTDTRPHEEKPRIEK